MQESSVSDPEHVRTLLVHIIPWEKGNMAKMNGSKKGGRALPEGQDSSHDEEMDESTLSAMASSD